MTLHLLSRSAFLSASSVALLWALGPVVACGPTDGLDDAGERVEDAGPATDGGVASADGGPQGASLEERFWEAFQTGDYAQTEALLAEVDQAPATFDDAILRGHLQLWRSAEFGVHSPPSDPAELIDLVDGAIIDYDQAYALNADERIPCWLGLMKVIKASATDDAALRTEGFEDIALGAALYPEFGLFCEVLGYERVPFAAPPFQNAVQAVWDLLDACWEAEVDRANPDVRPYLSQATTTGRKKVCWNTPRVPHQLEGLFLEAGDVLLKDGQPEVARVMFENALHVDDGTWAYRHLIDERLETLDDRSARFRDADPSNDPDIGAQHTCLVCHAH